MKKRILALLLTLCMLVPTIPFQPVSADNSNTEDTTDTPAGHQVCFDGYKGDNVGGKFEVDETVKASVWRLKNRTAGEVLGTIINISKDPQWEGYTFEGWLKYKEVIDVSFELQSEDVYTTEQVMQHTVPEHDVRYVAKWAEIDMSYYRSLYDPYYTPETAPEEEPTDPSEPGTPTDPEEPTDPSEPGTPTDPEEPEEEELHIYGTATYTWAEDLTSCTALRKCKHGSCTAQETETVKSVVTTQAATCAQEGKTTYTAEFENEAFETQTQEVAIPKLEHVWDEGEVTKEPTTEETGIRTFTCENCKTTKTEEIEKHVHQYTSVSTDATCTEDAYTTYTCACGDTYKEVKTGTKGHNYSSMIYQPTCTEAGYILFTCTCGDSYTEPRSDALGHSYKLGVCTRCGEEDPDFVPVELDAPQILSCYSKLQTSVKVTWSVVENAEGYELWRSETPDVETSWTRVKTVADGTVDRYTNQGLTEGVTYYYKVRAYVGANEDERQYSEFSGIDYMPAAVLWADPYSNATTRIRLRWSEVGGSHGYQIWRQDEAGEWKIIKTLGDKDNTLTDNQGATTAYSNTGLTAGENYTYKMRAFRITEDGRKVFGAYSNDFTVAVMPEATVLTLSCPANGQVQLEWNAVNGAAGYQIWMDADGTWKIIKSITDDSTSYLKTGLNAGNEYQFRIRAYTEVDGKKTFGAYSEVLASDATMPVPEKAKCGENLTWEVENSVLTISGTGAMYDFKDQQTPWIDLDIDKVVIESGVTTIGTYAFKSHNIANFTLPDTLKKIGDYAFLCAPIEKITIPSSVTEIGAAAFQMTNLVSITLPEGIKELKHGTFSNCEKLTEVVLPESMTVIGENAFLNAAKLESVALSSKLERIGNRAFEGCQGIIEVALPDSVTSMGKEVFKSCRSLEIVYLPRYLTNIPEGTFSGCSSLLAVLLPESLKTVEADAFRGCDALVEVYFPGTEEQIYDWQIEDGNDPLLYADLYLVTFEE